MPDVRMPDGAVVRFPQDMPPEQIRALIAQKFPELESANPFADLIPPRQGKDTALFELQAGGKTFEVEAPDMQSAIQALGLAPKHKTISYEEAVGPKPDSVTLNIAGRRVKVDGKFLSLSPVAYGRDGRVQATTDFRRH